MVQHLDDSFRRKLTQLYKQQIPANGAVLDLMSSWVSHLPKDVKYSLVVGHGMNAQEVHQQGALLQALRPCSQLVCAWISCWINSVYANIHLNCNRRTAGLHDCAAAEEEQAA